MSSISVPEAFILLTLPAASLTTNGFTHAGDLHIQHVTAAIPDHTGAMHTEVYLVLRLRELEIALDPDRPVSISTADPHRRVYSFGAANHDELQLAIPASTRADDVETLDTILAQYFTEFEHGGVLGFASMTALPEFPTGDALRPVPPLDRAAADKHRGQLVLVDEDSGAIVGELAARGPAHEDASLRASRDPVVVEVPDEAGLGDHDANARALFVRAIPPEQQTWLTKGAGLASYAIATGATLLVKGMGAAADMYVARAAKSPDHPDNKARAQGGARPTNIARADTEGAGTSTQGPADKPGLSSRTLTMLTSPRTRANMQRAHKYTGTAVQASARTVAAVDGLIRRAVYGREQSQATDGKGRGKGKRLAAAAAANTPSGSGYATPSGCATPSAAASSTSLAAMPPPYTPGQTLLAPEKPTLPPRRSPSPGVPYPVHTSVKGGGPPSPYAASPASYMASPESIGAPSPWTSDAPHAPSPSTGAPPPLPPRDLGPPSPVPRDIDPTPPPPLPPRDLRTRDRVLLSADLILSTIDDSTRQLIEAGVVNFGKVMGHRYGQDAGETSTLAARTAQNVGLVYIDLSGLGRRALIKRAGKHYVKSRLGSKGKDGAA
ncbi:hypothetical protein HDZ31DRAFT_63813 [Schizophyllum fasciatum]